MIDASGQYLIPGIIDCHSHIAVDGGVNEGSVSVSSMVNIRDVINPDDIAIYRALAGGVTTANILHGSANAIGGCTLPHQDALGQGRRGADLSRARRRASSSRWARIRSAPAIRRADAAPREPP